MHPHIEHHSIERDWGWIEVICGSMFSGKTEELIRRLRRAEWAQLNVQLVKPALDSRHSPERVTSHDRRSFRSQTAGQAGDLVKMAAGCDVLGIDEAQFFDNNLVSVCNDLAEQGVRVIVAGLDMDFRGRPFGPVPHIMAVAEHVTKLHAICVECGGAAHFSHRTSDQNEQVLVGAKEQYEALCRKHYYLRCS